MSTSMVGTRAEPRTGAATQPDQEKVEAFLEQLVGDIGAAVHGGALWIGDRLGLFPTMAESGPVTAAELAGATGLQERYLREWLSAMAAAEYVSYDPADGRYHLPAEHALPLADRTFPFYVGGFLEFIVPLIGVAPQVAEAFRRGGGVPQSAYMDEMYEAIERASAPFQQQRLVDWLDGTSTVVQKLSAGGSLADVGCGAGQAAIVLAEAFPAVQVTGYDIHAGSLERARRNAAQAGVTDRVTFEIRDGVDIPTDAFDVVTTFDVIHDSADPAGLLRAIRNALTGGGTYLAVEMNAASRVEDNIGPVGRLMYSISLLYCMTTSLAQGGVGLGTCMGEERFRELAADAGFGDVRTVPIDNPFFVLYELKA